MRMLLRLRMMQNALKFAAIYWKFGFILVLIFLRLAPERYLSISSVSVMYGSLIIAWFCYQLIVSLGSEHSSSLESVLGDHVRYGGEETELQNKLIYPALSHGSQRSVCLVKR